MKKNYLECGRVVAPHGVRGLVKIEHWCDSPKVLASQKRVFLAEKDGSYKEICVTGASVSGNLVIASLEGVDSRECAQAMKNTVLYLHRADIPLAKGAVLIADMIGLPVIDVDTGEQYGTLTEVNEGVRGKLYTVSSAKGDVLIPGIPEFVKEIDAERGVFIRPIPGFFD